MNNPNPSVPLPSDQTPPLSQITATFQPNLNVTTELTTPNDDIPQDIALQQVISKKNTQKTRFHHESCCSTSSKCFQFGSPILLKQNLLYRLLYTNPVCLLTSVNAPLRPTEIISPQEPRKENVMTITWLTPTDNCGNIFLSMNATRFSLQNIQKTKRFVLNIPVAGSEEVVKQIGKCSGRDFGNDLNIVNNQYIEDSKLKHLNLSTSSIAFKNNPLLSSLCSLSDTMSSDHMLVDSRITGRQDNAVLAEHIEQLIKRNYSGNKLPTTPEYADLSEELRKSLEFGDVVLNDCVAHIVCEVIGIISPLCSESTTSAIPTATIELPPNNGNPVSNENFCFVGKIGTPQHVSIFAKMKLGAVRNKYWTRALFQPQSPSLPPYLTFLGQSEFLHCTTPSKIE